MQILSDSFDAVNSVIAVTSPDFAQKGKIKCGFSNKDGFKHFNRTSSEAKDRYKAHYKEQNLLVGICDENFLASSLLKRLILQATNTTQKAQSETHTVKQLYEDFIHPSGESHDYGWVYKTRKQLIEEINQGSLDPKTISRNIEFLKEKGFIEVSKHHKKPQFRKSSHEGPTYKKNFVKQQNSYRINWLAILDAAASYIVLSKQKHNYYFEGQLSPIMIAAAVFGKGFYRLKTAAQAYGLEKEEAKTKQKIEALEAAETLPSSNAPNGTKCPLEIYKSTSNEVNLLKKEKTSSADEVEVLKKSDLGGRDQTPRPLQRHPGGIRRFLASYETPLPLDLTVEREPRIEPVVDYATKAPVPNNLPDVFNNTQGVANRLGKSLKTRPHWQPDMNTQLARNWRAEILGQEASRPNTQVQYTGEVRGRYRVLESTKTHEKAPPAAKVGSEHSQVAPRLETALQRLLDASREERPSKEPAELLKAEEKPHTHSSPPDTSIQEDQVLRERLEAKRKALGLV